MKRILTSVFVGGLMCLLASSCSKPVEVTVMSYNIRNSFSKDGENAWVNRRDANVLMLDSLQPGIFGVQEAQNDQMEYLKQNLEQYEAVGVGRDDGDKKGEYTGVFYRTDLFDLLDKGWFWLCETPDQVAMGWDAACMRTVTWVKLKEKKSGKELYFFNTHIDHRGDTARRESVKLIIDRVNNEVGDTPVFITGDFNMRPEDERIQPMFEAFSSTQQQAPVTDSHKTFNNWSTDKPGGIIDYIFYRNAQPLEYRTVTENYGVPFVSDHYPIMAKFKLE